MAYRIACFSARYLPERDSESYVTAKWAQALRQRGHEIDVFSTLSLGVLPHRGARPVLDLYTALRRAVRAIELRTAEISQVGRLTGYVSSALAEYQSRQGRRPYDLIVTRYEPIDSAIAGYWASLKSGVPWIASYNDPIPRRTVRRIGVKGMLDAHRNAFQYAWSRRLLDAPDWVVFPSARLRDSAFASRDSLGTSGLAIHPQACSIIPHIGGMIADGPRNAFPFARDASQPDNIIIVRHVGYLSPRRDLRAFLEALELLESRDDAPFILVEFIGRVTTHQDEIDRFNAGRRKRTHIRVLSEVDQTAAFRLMLAADVCLLIEEPASESPFLPSKFCDYAVAGRPILAVTCSESTVSDYLVKHGGGIAVGHESPADVAAALIELFRTKTSTSALAREFEPSLIAEAWEEVCASVKAQRAGLK